MRSRSAARRCLTSVVVVISVLFSQLALASYLCPGMASPAQMAPMADGVPCEGMDPATPVLCHQHATDASQTFEMAKVAAPTLPVVIHVLVIPLLLDPGSAASLPFQGRPEAQPPPDPVFLQTLRLRV
jgi:hypothetical protein